MSMITAAQWVPRGVAAAFPTKYNFDESEFQRIAELAKLQLDDANEDLEEAQGAEKDTEEARSGAGPTECKKNKKSRKEKADEYVRTARGQRRLLD